jgi:hypothetical protein
MSHVDVSAEMFVALCRGLPSLTHLDLGQARSGGKHNREAKNRFRGGARNAVQAISNLTQLRVFEAAAFFYDDLYVFCPL